ncbi:hypothetical protein BAJUN_00380 [Bajunvirus bajun]|uniref:Uncharacterized protein n=1 Tax=Brevundimonas phage vB_BgoS-Bajun TaxID=2948594 RepID=A0A9E7N6I4_9CAUD|nr:hypothetical protein BAJUN_00380 [Brevundimonas phage vB_BgoS-Bajun]
MRVFAPLILTYVLLFAAVVFLSLHTPTPWRDPRFKPLMWRVLLFPAVLMSLTFGAFALVSWFIDFGFVWAIFVIFPGGLMLAIGLISLALGMVGSVRKVLNNRPAIEILKEN